MALPDDDTTSSGLVFEAGLFVPMRDGVRLCADLHRPAGPGPFPALILRTPYGRATDPAELRLARRAVERGYAVLLQDVRGRHGSEGEFVPHRSEGRDGYDSIEWLAAREWCDGRVGMVGLSYPGSVQWFAALERPPHLLAMAPAMTFSRLRDAVRSQGVFDMDWLGWAYIVMAPDLRARACLPGPKGIARAEADWRERIAKGRDLRDTLPLLALPELDACMGFLRDWLEHGPDDPWWDFGDVAGRCAGVDAAVLHLAGWHDDGFTVAGAMANHSELCSARAARGLPPRSRLVLGPWAHGIGAVTGDISSGQRDFGPDARLDYDGLVLDFMDEHVRGVPGPAAPAVRYFVMGENRWREADAWPPRPADGKARELTLHLASNGGLTLAPPQPGESAFTADPARPVPEVPGSGMGAADHAGLTGRPDTLCFDSAPLATPLTVAGNIRAEICIAADAPDLDLYVRLLDVSPDEGEGGRAFNLMDIGAEVQRVSRQGGPLAPGEVRRVRLDAGHTANAFMPGHRVRVLVCASWHPGMSRNPQTGADEAHGADLRPASIRVLHGPEHPSRVVLPLIDPA
jgi:putative CocE/NonD family hydrolase